MKKLILIAIVIVGCKTKHEVYGDKFDAYSDSIFFYADKANCYRKCNESDSASLAVLKMSMYNDSANKYYVLMYPNGNPADKDGEEKTPNCNCK